MGLYDVSDGGLAGAREELGKVPARCKEEHRAREQNLQEILEVNRVLMNLSAKLEGEAMQ